MTYTFMERMGNAHTHILQGDSRRKVNNWGDIKVIVKKKVLYGGSLWKIFYINLLTPSGFLTYHQV